MNFFLHVLFASRFKADYLLEVDIVGLKKPDKDPLNKKKKTPPNPAVERENPIPDQSSTLNTLDSQALF